MLSHKCSPPLVLQPSCSTCRLSPAAPLQLYPSSVTVAVMVLITGMITVMVMVIMIMITVTVVVTVVAALMVV